VKIFDFGTFKPELQFEGHRSDVKTCAWHPYESMIVSAGRDSEIKFWDPKSGKEVYTIQSHYNAINKVRWNKNGNWLLSGSKDTSIKIYDVRVMKDFRTFQAHEDEINALEWHPDCEELFVSGGGDGMVVFWMANEDEAYYKIDKAHYGACWDLAWHPMGNCLATAGNDTFLQLWARPKPGEGLEDPKIRLDERVAEMNQAKPAGMYGGSKLFADKSYISHKKAQSLAKSKENIQRGSKRM